MPFQNNTTNPSKLKSFINSVVMTSSYAVSYWILLVFCLLINKTALSSDAPTSSTTEEKDVRISHRIQNGDAILSCIVKDLGRRRIIWSRLSDPYPISVGTMRFHPSRKYRVVNEADTNVLTIRQVGLEDAGEYQCLVSGGFPLKEVLSLNIQAGPKTTYFLPTNRTLVSAVGMDVTLPCHVENINDKMVMWKDGRNNVLSLRKRVYNGDNRLKVVHDTRPQWDLSIQKLSETDFGFYTCVVNSDPVLTRTIELINDTPPQIAPVLMKDKGYRNKITAMEGETVRMSCHFHAYPPATIKWYIRYKDENSGKTKKKDLFAEGNELSIRSVRADQAGTYLCIGRNGMKQEGKAKTRLTVKVAPTTVPTTVATTVFVPHGPTAPRVYYEQKRFGQRRGRDAELTCFAVGQPRPNVYWLRYGHRVVNDHKYKITSVQQGRYTRHSTLLLRSVSSRDYGMFECVTHNQYGKTQLMVELYDSSKENK